MFHSFDPLLALYCAKYVPYLVLGIVRKTAPTRIICAASSLIYSHRLTPPRHCTSLVVTSD